MNDLQTVEFEILKQFIQICDVLNLNYYLVCGSALGAVKYEGFIPWDDDVDVALPRHDYEIFLREAPKYLPDYLFLQTYKTDTQYPIIYAKIRNSNTTYIESSSSSLKINHGIFIDVFPLDGYPETVKEQKRLERTKKVYMLQRLSVFEGNFGLKASALRKILRAFGVHKKVSKSIEKIERIVSAYDTDKYKIWCNHGNWQEKVEYAPQWQYGEGAYATFEGLKVRIPEKFDEYLTQKYGNWRAEPSKEEQVGHHYYTYMDTEKSYTYYFDK